MRVRAPVSTPAGKQDLDGPHQIPPAASENELQDRRFVSGEDLLEDLQRWSVGPEAEGQVDGAAEPLDQDALLRGTDGILLGGALRFGLLLAAVRLGGAVAGLFGV